VIRQVFVVVVDEHIQQYEPTTQTQAVAAANGEPIPKVYIPRKPHPNGLLAHLLASYVIHPARPEARLPFVVDFEYHLTVGDAAPEKALLAMYQR